MYTSNINFEPSTKVIRNHIRRDKKRYKARPRQRTKMGKLLA